MIDDDWTPERERGDEAIEEEELKEELIRQDNDDTLYEKPTREIEEGRS